MVSVAAMGEMTGFLAARQAAAPVAPRTPVKMVVRNRPILSELGS